MGSRTHRIDGNETADQLTTSGSSHPLIRPQPTLVISAKVAKRVIRDWRSRKYEHWPIRGERQATGFHKTPSAQRAGKLLNLSIIRDE